MSRILVVDFDGTITEADMLDSIAQAFGDEAVNAEVDSGLDAERLTLREVITREFEPVHAPMDEVVAWALERVRVRAGFRDFVDLARERGWRIVIVSSGFQELIAPVLEREGVEVEVRANQVDLSEGYWRVLWHYEGVCDSCGESCKRTVVQELAGEDEIVYVGDGYSDRCAAQVSDRVFARAGLARYLESEGVPFEPFSDFHEIARALS